MVGQGFSPDKRRSKPDSRMYMRRPCKIGQISAKRELISYRIMPIGAGSG